LDSVDNRVENLRKEAIKLQDQRDHLLTRIDMLKNTDLLTNLSEADQEEVSLQLKRINERLQVNLLTFFFIKHQKLLNISLFLDC
jgi:BCL2-associated athanogene 2